MQDRSYTSYFIVGTQRSGTTVTHHCLLGHPAVSVLPEELAHDPFFTEGMSAFTHELPGTEAEQKEGRRALFNALTELERTSRTEACGVKCAFGHGSQGDRFTEVLQRDFPDVRVIFVTRRDSVAQFGSFCKAQELGVWHQEGQDGEAKTPKLTLDPYRFVGHMLDIHETEQHLRRLKETHETMVVEYEPDILNGDLASEERLFSFLGIEPREATWLQLRKVSPEPEAYIANYHHLRDLQSEVKEQLAAGCPPSELRKEYSPPLLKSLYRTGKYWIEHPEYAAYRVGKGIKTLLGSSNADAFSS